MTWWSRKWKKWGESKVLLEKFKIKKEFDFSFKMNALSSYVVKIGGNVQFRLVYTKVWLVFWRTSLTTWAHNNHKKRYKEIRYKIESWFLSNVTKKTSYSSILQCSWAQTDAGQNTTTIALEQTSVTNTCLQSNRCWIATTNKNWAITWDSTLIIRCNATATRCSVIWAGTCMTINY